MLNPSSFIPAPYRIAAWIVAVLLIAGLIFAGGFKEGSIRVRADWDAEKIAVAAQAAIAEQENRAKELALSQKLQEAQHAATIREIKLRSDASSAAAAASRLRDTIATIRGQLPEYSGSAAAVTADAGLVVFGECAQEYRALAERADRHASDAKTCGDAWPK